MSEIHYEYDKEINEILVKKEEEFLIKLIEDHWKYIKGVLSPHKTQEELEELGFHYKAAMRHGWRHAKEYFTGSV